MRSRLDLKEIAKSRLEFNVGIVRPGGDVKQDEIIQPKGRPLLFIDSTIFKDVRVSLQAKLGQVTLTVADLLALKAGSVVKLDLQMNELIELRLNESVVARGEIVAVDDNFGVRIVEVAHIS